MSSELSSKLQDIEKGNHDDKKCEEYCQEYKENFDQELPDCQFKGNKFKIQNLIRKVHIDVDGSETEVVNPLDKEIQTLMSSNMAIQQVHRMGFDESLIKSTLKKQILKSGQPFFDPNSLVLALLDSPNSE